MRYYIAKTVRWVPTPEGAILLDVRRGKYFSLNKLGLAIWQELAAGRDVADILRSLNTKFTDAEPHTLTRDLTTYLEALLRTRVLDVDNTSV